MMFQCSSASRKFLKLIGSHLPEPDWHVSVLFSEPKIPQICAVISSAPSSITWFQCSSASRKFLKVSRRRRDRARARFQCSSASRKFLKRTARAPSAGAYGFQCSSASRKFLKCRGRTGVCGFFKRFQCSSASRKFLKFPRATGASPSGCCFSALQRAENSSKLLVEAFPGRVESFSALQRAENSSN